MISERKKYIIELFLKRCMTLHAMEKYINFTIDLMEKSHDISEEDSAEIKKKYNIDDYINRMIPVIDNQLTIAEMQEAIRFFSNGVGRKMQEPNFLHKIGRVSEKMISQIEQEFAIKNE